MAGQERTPGLDSRSSIPFYRITGGAEFTSAAAFSVNNVGGTIAGKKEMARQMVGGRMEGGRTVDVIPVFGESDFVNIRAIIAKAVSQAGSHELTVDDVATDKRINELPDYESQLIDDITLAVEGQYLGNRNIPDSMVAFTRTARDVWEAVNILRIQESPIPSLSLAEAKLQLANAWMYNKAARERDLWAKTATKEKLEQGWGGEEYVREITAVDIRGTEAR